MLNSKQRAYLRKLAQTEEPIFQVGKGIINDNLVKQIKDALEKRELIKITMLDTAVDMADGGKEGIAEEIARLTKSEVVQVLGKKITLYKKSSKKPKITFDDEKKEEKPKKGKPLSKAKLKKRF